jgi:hypothetical protein
MIPLRTPVGLLTPFLSAPLRLPGFRHRHPSGGGPALSSGAVRLHAWLQCFLF